VTEQTTSGFSSEHRSPEEIAAYLCDALPAADRERFQAHLAACRACRWEVTSAQRLTRARPRETGRNIALAAAVVLVAVLLTRGMGVRGAGPEGEAQRRSTERVGGAQTIDIVSPGDGGTVASPPVVFTWRGRPGSFMYRLTLSTDDGRTLWTGDTRDSTLALPSNVVLDRGRGFFWYVDALGSDARSSTSGVHRFSTPP
jgi:hypothetical protein